MMTKTSVVAAMLLSLAIGLGPAWAQQAETQTPPPAAAPAAKPAMSAEKKAISKKCSDLANAKGLHGKERKKFRADCKRKGGNVE
jgi:psiF repeat